MSRLGTIKFVDEAAGEVWLNYVTDFSESAAPAVNVSRDLTDRTVVQIFGDGGDLTPRSISVASLEGEIWEADARIHELMGLRNQILAMTFWDGRDYKNLGSAGVTYQVVISSDIQKRRYWPTGIYEVAFEVAVIS